MTQTQGELAYALLTGKFCGQALQADGGPTIIVPPDLDRPHRGHIVLDVKDLQHGLFRGEPSRQTAGPGRGIPRRRLDFVRGKDAFRVKIANSAMESCTSSIDCTSRPMRNVARRRAIRYSLGLMNDLSETSLQSKKSLARVASHQFRTSMSSKLTLERKTTEPQKLTFLRKFGFWEPHWRAIPAGK